MRFRWISFRSVGKIQALLVFVRWICAVGKPNVLECAVGLGLPITVLQLGEGAENRSRNFQFSTDLSKTAWCCELTIFLAKTKRFLRQSKPKFSTYTELRSFAKLPVICSAFCSVGLEICRSSGGKFILFWRRAKDGREKLFCSLWFCGGWSGLQMCFSLCVGLFCLFCDEGCKKYKIGLEFYK